MRERRDTNDGLSGPEVMFLPLAATPSAAWGDLDPGVVSRRIPDFVHQVLNQGQAGPTAMLELQTASDEGPVTWVQLEEPPDRDEAFELMPPQLFLSAVVSGEVEPVEGGLRLEFHVFCDEDAEDFLTEKIGCLLPTKDPVSALMKLARRLARLVELPFHEPPSGLLTRRGPAFWQFLHGLDNAMLLSGDLEIELPEDRGGLIQPFADAIELDPRFGLALRVASATSALALHGARIDRESVRRFLDRCYSANPFDGDACVAVSEQLSDMGEDERAFAWLEYATELDPPPSRGLESLGILKVRSGDPDAARGLWEKGLSVDGHPDFFSHLAQLSFAQGLDKEAWDFIIRGLRRLRERMVRSAEWSEQDGTSGVLLECLQAHLVDREAPAGLLDALFALRGTLHADDRAALGLCLFSVGRRAESRVELLAGMRATEDLSARDRAVRALLQIDVADFESRFAKATDRSLRGRNPKPALAEFRLWLHLQPEFWPALYYSAIVKRRLGCCDDALDLFAAALELSPDQADILYEMAELFSRRGNSKHALELVDRALTKRDAEARLHAAKARYLRDLSRPDEARMVIARARNAGIDSPELRRFARSLRRG